jgi:hypothetical protein
MSSACIISTSYYHHHHQLLLLLLMIVLLLTDQHHLGSSLLLDSRFLRALQGQQQPEKLSGLPRPATAANDSSSSLYNSQMIQLITWEIKSEELRCWPYR